GQQLSPSSRLPRCFAVPPGWGKKRPSMLVRETNRRPFGARCGGDLLWIINTLGIIFFTYMLHFIFQAPHMSRYN
ncbi:hypothetical protein P4S95_05050, partial [Aneurinibacillus aneurinilyticus]|uniref:hypothetical protein n=1 Tax=Aneurinibacillus aneurinilyticus TaxID=1391 RepID=UPI002E1CE6C1|nr:hypothetical protein [Aneurinibacillus aneurinilyticus]